MADPRERDDGKGGQVEVTDIDTMTALVRITFVFVAVGFMLTANRFYDVSLYVITVLFLILQAAVLMALARNASMGIGRPAAMLAEHLERDEQDLDELRERNARLTDQVRALAVVEERNRLARELHDSVKQHLFSLAMTACSVK